jgi:hypothetical protein
MLFFQLPQSNIVDFNFVEIVVVILANVNVQVKAIMFQHLLCKVLIMSLYFGHGDL